MGEFQDVPAATLAHYRRMQQLQALALGSALSGWKRVAPAFILASWGEVVGELTSVVSNVQRRAALAGSSYNADTLVQSSSVWRQPDGFVNPDAFAGYSSSGVPISSTLMAPAFYALSRIKEGVPSSKALASGRNLLQGIIRTQVTDAARVASGVDAATRAGVGYIRMLNPPSCSRCVILAGRRYRWNQGFLRHPRCDCVHVLATTAALNGASSEGLLVDQYDYFESLSEADQDRLFTNDGAQAIRDGADMNRVVNARKGMAQAGAHRTGVLSDAKQKRKAGLSFRGDRLTPEGIYATAGSRKEAVEMLERYGYLYPGGQTPGGARIGWDYEGFGQMGRGGTRRNVDHLTAAQRRLQNARLSYEAALEGRNPYGRGDATPAVKAQAENEYRAWLASGGEIFTE